MKVFLTLQAALIAVTLLLCLHARGLSELQFLLIGYCMPRVFLGSYITYKHLG